MCLGLICLSNVSLELFRGSTIYYLSHSRLHIFCREVGCFLRQVLTMWLLLAWNTLCIPGRPKIHKDLPASDS